MDPVHFSGKELIEMALKIEDNGLRFYQKAGEASKSEELKNLFRFLADEEKNHIKVFNDLKSLASETTPGPQEESYFGEASQYLHAIADTEVFTNPNRGEELASEVTDENQAIDYAIDMEKDSLLFYYEFQRMIREKDKKVLEKLIEQEKEHVQKLRDLKRKFAAK